jgi:spore germination protein
MKKNICLFLILLILIFNGCSQPLEQAQLEDFGLVEVIGYDMGKEGKSKVTIAYPKTDSETEAKTQIYSTEIDVTREALIDVSKKSCKSIHFGQLRVVLFSEDFARKRGLEHIVKEIYQDPVIGNNVFIAIVNGTVEDFLNDKALETEKPNFTAFLIDLLKPRKETLFNPCTNIHNFIYSFTNEVSDPMAPFLVKESEEIEIKEIAIFKGDKMIDTIALSWVLLSSGSNKYLRGIK